MKRKKPSFNETYHGYRTFSELLEDAQQQGMLELETDNRSGTYVVTSFGEEKAAPASPARRRRRRRPRRRAAPGGRERSESPENDADNEKSPSSPDTMPPEAFDEEFIPWPDE